LPRARMGWIQGNPDHMDCNGKDHGMKKRPLVALVMLLLIWPVLAEGAVQGMLICIHESADHTDDVVHFHPEDFFRHEPHPCRQSQSETCPEDRETTCRHIPVGANYSLDTVPSNSAARFHKTVLMCAFELPSQTPALLFCANGPSDNPLPSKATAFRKTTVLLI
jgi:hypothetical protein